MNLRFKPSLEGGLPLLGLFLLRRFFSLYDASLELSRGDLQLRYGRFKLGKKRTNRIKSASIESGLNHRAESVDAISQHESMSED